VLRNCLKNLQVAAIDIEELTLFKDAETRSIGHAQPSDPGSVNRFVVPYAKGKAKAAGAPGDGCIFLRIFRAHAVVRRPIFCKFSLAASLATRV
jgi:hypothetical protein